MGASLREEARISRFDMLYVGSENTHTYTICWKRKYAEISYLFCFIYFNCGNLTASEDIAF